MPESKLLDKIKDLYSAIDNSMDEDVRATMVKTYWNIGRLTLAYQQKTGLTVAQIARGIGANKTSLQRFTQFYKTYSKGYPLAYYGKIINWSMFYVVLPVHDKKAREFYLKEACRDGWDKYEMMRRIKDNYYWESTAAEESNKNKTLKDRGQVLYTYKAEVLKVVDGDTLDLLIDVGFKGLQEHRVRLRGINCPEMSTKKGQQAKDFVVKQMQGCIVEKSLFKGGQPGNPLVITRTYKRGLYGRYLADIFYLAGETRPDVILQKGKMLNQVLLDQGLARKVE